MTKIIHVAESWDAKYTKKTLCGCNTKHIRVPFILHKEFASDVLLEILKIRGVGGEAPTEDIRWCKNCFKSLKDHTVEFDEDDQFTIDVMLGKRSVLERLIQ